MMSRARLPAVDEANLVIDREGQVNVFLAAGILAPGGFVAPDGTPDVDVLRDALADRLHAISALRRIPVRAWRRHRWIEVVPDLVQHIRLAPPLRDRDDLERWCGHLMATPLPRSRPLWELLVARHSDGNAAFVLRVHHAIADGMAAVQIVQRMLGVEPAASDSSPRMTTDAATRRPRRPALSRAVSGARRMIATLFARGIADTVLLGRRGAVYGVAFVETDLDALRSAARRLNATVNDALLAAVARGLRTVVTAAGEALPAGLPVSVPVALPREGAAGNRVGIMVARLPLSAESAEERLRLIAAQTREARVAAREQGTLELMRGPLGARIMNRIARHQHLVAAFVTNVPGPPERLGLAGAGIETIWPVAVIAGNVRVGVAAVSYAGQLCCGIHFDADHIDGAAIAAAMRQEFEALT